jgi:hypothetical protein
MRDQCGTDHSRIASAATNIPGSVTARERAKAAARSFVDCVCRYGRNIHQVGTFIAGAHLMLARTREKLEQSVAQLEQKDR